MYSCWLSSSSGPKQQYYFFVFKFFRIGTTYFDKLKELLEVEWPDLFKEIQERNLWLFQSFMFQLDSLQTLEWLSHLLIRAGIIYLYFLVLAFK